MSAAASGQQRVDSMSSRAEALDAAAAELTAKAAALRDVAGKVRLGNEGELAVGAALDSLLAVGWHVLHDRRKSAQSPANLDHIVVGPPGVLVVDTKNWTGGLLHADDRGMKLGRWRKDDALHAARVDAELVEGLARQVVPAVHVVGVLAFVQDVGVTGPQLHQGVILAQQSQLVPWLTGLPHLLNEQQVAALAERLDRELRPRRSPVRTSAMDGTKARPSSRRTPGEMEAASPSRSSARQQRKQVKARHQLKSGLIRVAVLVTAGVTLPVTLPILQQYVMTPVAELMSERLVDSVQPPEPAPSGAAS